MRWNSSSDTKLYHFPGSSVWRGFRVVQEMENMISGSCRIFSTSVDLPQPEGPETIKANGEWDEGIGVLETVLPGSALFHVLHLFPQALDFGLHFERQIGDGQPLGFNPRGFREHGVGLALHFLQQEIELLTRLRVRFQQRVELLQVAAQARYLLADV